MDNLKVKLRRLRLRRGAMRVRRLLARGDYDGAQAIARALHQDEIAERKYLCERIFELGGEIPRTFPETQMRNMRLHIELILLAFLNATRWLLDGESRPAAARPLSLKGGVPSNSQANRRQRGKDNAHQVRMA